MICRIPVGALVTARWGVDAAAAGATDSSLRILTNAPTGEMKLASLLSPQIALGPLAD